MESKILLREWVVIAVIGGLIGSLITITWMSDVQIKGVFDEHLRGLGDSSIALKIEGAVDFPGTYHFTPGVRLKEILKEAGLKKDADRPALEFKEAYFESQTIQIPYREAGN